MRYLVLCLTVSAVVLSAGCCVFGGSCPGSGECGASNCRPAPAAEPAAGIPAGDKPEKKDPHIKRVIWSLEFEDDVVEYEVEKCHSGPGRKRWKLVDTVLAEPGAGIEYEVVDDDYQFGDTYRVVAVLISGQRLLFPIKQDASQE